MDGCCEGPEHVQEEALHPLLAGRAPARTLGVLPGSILFSGGTSALPPSGLARLLEAEFTILIMLAAILPSVIGSYSFIGEKVEKSLEPLLATPATDVELLLGKCVAAFLPSVGATYVGAMVFMVIADAGTYGRLGYLLFPNLDAVIVLFLAIPFASALSVEFSVIGLVPGQRHTRSTATRLTDYLANGAHLSPRRDWHAFDRPLPSACDFRTTSCGRCLARLRESRDVSEGRDTHKVEVTRLLELRRDRQSSETRPVRARELSTELKPIQRKVQHAGRSSPAPRASRFSFRPELVWRFSPGSRARPRGTRRRSSGSTPRSAAEVCGRRCRRSGRRCSLPRSW